MRSSTRHWATPTRCRPPTRPSWSSCTAIPTRATRCGPTRPVDTGYCFVDPDGFVADRAYDLGVTLRDWCARLHGSDARGTLERTASWSPSARGRRRRTGSGAGPIWSASPPGCTSSTSAPTAVGRPFLDTAALAAGLTRPRPGVGPAASRLRWPSGGPDGGWAPRDGVGVCSRRCCCRPARRPDRADSAGTHTGDRRRDAVPVGDTPLRPTPRAATPTPTPDVPHPAPRPAGRRPT